MMNDYKFQGLMNFFKHNQMDKVKLTYAQIEEIIGVKLCNSAYKYRPYWSSTKTHTITRAWKENGWKISSIELGNYIEFEREKNILIEKYLNLIKNAFNRVQSKYYRLTTTYQSDGIIRERVFCYELYHQIRVLQSEDEKIILNGEIDKRGHKDFLNKDRKNPDFIFHIPGEFQSNTIVCEVKGIIRQDIMKDFETIIKFITNYRYKAGIFILYNHNMKELREYLATKNKFHDIDKDIAESIYIYVKKDEFSELQNCKFSDIV